ncbi:H-type lectin domain-containing protein [Thalassovita mediterranea]|jgi:hypothetical protein|uniref:H-type lectin domain protein n=1 Tax=Thalassovita mediterranea TaxID=340021 RepID=A0A0P1H3X4_9RHOB|nr:H-type lectin domain-containing protein [Thalassovita mediterranea]MCG7572423.1 H-type lectin domain-containing protein [Phaeobacter sp. CNT1-3]CUH84520.1 H-type lectin domain protein [Thalassovita mediterranea]SIS34364.1 H-type lectin domain-containing protein [Thalassovita mediterranea]
MRKISNNNVGVEQGQQNLFSDFEDGGEMWTGQGARECRVTVQFSEPFRAAPNVMVSMSMWDVDQSTNVRTDLEAENITPQQFDIVFRTWGDTRVARARAGWMAIGPVADEDHWDVP